MHLGSRNMLLMRFGREAEAPPKNPSTLIVGVRQGKDSGELGIYTNTNFIPLCELSYRELEKTLNVIHFC